MTYVKTSGQLCLLEGSDTSFVTYYRAQMGVVPGFVPSDVKKCCVERARNGCKCLNIKRKMMFCSCSKFRGGRAPRRPCFFLWITSCKTSLDLSVPPKNSCPLPSPLILARTLEQWEQIRISLV